jgi:hypothetical protein
LASLSLRRPGLDAAALTLLLGSVLWSAGWLGPSWPRQAPRASRLDHRERGDHAVARAVILFAWPGSTLWVLGIFLGVDLIVEDVAYILLGSSIRRALRPGTV